MCNSTPSAPEAPQELRDLYKSQAETGKAQSDFMLNTFLPKYLQQQDQYNSTNKQLTDEQIAASQSQRGLAKVFQDRMQKYAFPIQNQMAVEAQNAGGEADQAHASGQAQADVTQSMEAQKAMRQRQMFALGVNPNSGAFQDQAGRDDVNEALGRASAGTRARDMAKQLGWAKRSDAAAVLSGNQSGQASAMATAMSGYGQANGMAAGPMSTMNAGAGAFTSGMSSAGSMYGGAGQGFQGLYNSQLNSWNMQNQSSNQNSAGLGSLAGAAMGAAAIF